MRIGFMSDIHHEIYDGKYQQEEVPQNIDVMVIAGDLDNDPKRAVEWMERVFPKEILIIYITGNHEYYSKQIEDQNEAIRLACLHSTHRISFLNNGAIVYKNPNDPNDYVAFFGATMWTDFKLFGEGKSVECETNILLGMNDFKKIKTKHRKFQIKDWKKLNQEHMGGIEHFLNNTKLTEEGIKKCVITHHAPSKQSLHDKYAMDDRSPGYASNLVDLIIDKGPELWIHGHCHHGNDYMIEKTRIVSNPRGYMFWDVEGELRGFDASRVVEI